MIARKASLLFATFAGAAGCSKSVVAPGYHPQLPSAWATTVTNAYFPLTPGSVFHYSGRIGSGVRTVTTTVKSAPKIVNGVLATEVHDEVFMDGALIEDTYDWYAQDTAGNVWYLGEDSKTISNGNVTGTTGSWRWGVGGALPGIQMWSNPGAHIGESYRQEFSRGVAQDLGKVVAVSQAITVPAGSFTGCVMTEDLNELAPNEGAEKKVYCPQVGLVSAVDPGELPLQLTGRTR